MDRKRTDQKLKGKTALVLGGIKGIGRAIAMDLLSKGASVAVTYYDWLEELPNLKKDLESSGGKSSIHQINLRETGKIKELIDEIADIHGGIDILINNIERGGMPVVHGDYTEAQWNLEQETTLRAKHFVFMNVFPHMKKQNEGCVINISSIAGIVGRTGPAGIMFNDGYSAANRGISLFTETWARLGAPKIRVNELMLGFMETRHGPKTRGWGLMSDKEKQDIIDHTLCGRTGKISDILKALDFIISDAPFLNGAVIRLDGGYVLGGEKIPPMPEGVE